MQLSDIKNPIVYERLWDNRPKRTIAEHIDILKDLSVDMIFRANWRFNPMPTSCSVVDVSQRQVCINSGYTREQQTEIISAIKQAVSGIEIIGAVPTQKMNKSEINELTGKTYPDTYYMGLDPAKWGIRSPTKTELQQRMSGTVAVGGYYPDITNPDFQDLFMSWVEEQALTSVTGIWIDLLYTQAQILLGYTQDVNHPAVKESFLAANDLINKVRTLGLVVGTWAYPVTNYASAYGITPNLDFVTDTPSVDEVQRMVLDNASWVSRIQETRNVFGDIPFFVFIDWAGKSAQTGVFSQKNPTDQRTFLHIAQSFFENKGIKFIYPVHGGVTAVKAYGKDYWYDALAPEFQTYDTIKSLMTGGITPPPPQPLPPSSTNKVVVAAVAAVIIGGILWYIKSRSGR